MFEPLSPKMENTPVKAPAPPVAAPSPCPAPKVTFEQASIHYAATPIPSTYGGVIQMMVNPHAVIYTGTMNANINAYNAAMAAPPAPGAPPAAAFLNTVLAEYRTLSAFRQYLCRNEGLLTEIMHEFVDTAPAGDVRYGHAMSDGFNIVGLTQDKPSFDATMAGDINEISSTPTGQQLLSALHKKKHDPAAPHSVMLAPNAMQEDIAADFPQGAPAHMLQAGGVNVANAGSSMDLAIDSTSAMIGLAPRYIGLAHDLIHGIHVINGVRADNATLMDDNAPGAAPGALPIAAQQFLVNDPVGYGNDATPDDAAVMGLAPPGGPALVPGMAGGLPVVPTVQYPAPFANFNQITENRIRDEHHVALRTQY